MSYRNFDADDIDWRTSPNGNLCFFRRGYRCTVFTYDTYDYYGQYGWVVNDPDKQATWSRRRCRTQEQAMEQAMECYDDLLD